VGGEGRGERGGEEGGEGRGREEGVVRHTIDRLSLEYKNTYYPLFKTEE
jgi:hypothetical protein